MSIKNGPPLGYRRYLGWDWKYVPIPGGRRWVILGEPHLVFYTCASMKAHIRTKLGRKPATEEE